MKGVENKRKPPRSKPGETLSGFAADRFEPAGGRREQLLGALRDCYGIATSEAEHQLRVCEDRVERTYETEGGNERGRLRAASR